LNRSAGSASTQRPWMMLPGGSPFQDIPRHMALMGMDHRCKNTHFFRVLWSAGMKIEHMDETTMQRFSTGYVTHCQH
jgi:hypothetical protein